MWDGVEAGWLGGRYELGGSLGHGGMAEVWAAIDHRLERAVAVKMLRPDLARQTAVRRRFETEARAAARLSHPNVVVVYDTGEDAGVPYLVMERLPGRTLADEIARGPLSPERVREVAAEVLAALDAAHEAGILHRDIKPANVLMTDDGHAKVSDFGIAKIADAVDETLTGQLLATPDYLAPERAMGAPATAQSDVYSVGILLYEALSGQRPFRGDSPLAVLRALDHDRPTPLPQLRPELAPDLVATVERAMARDPDRRFANARAMRDALTATRPAEAATVPAAGSTRRLIPIWAPTSELPRTVTARLPTAAEHAHAPEASVVRSKPRRWIRHVIVAGLLGAAVVALLALVANRDEAAAPRTTTTSAPSAAATSTTPTTLASSTTPTVARSTAPTAATSTTPTTLVTTPAQPQTIGDLIALLSGDPASYGSRADDLRRALERIAAAQSGPGGSDTARLIEQINRAVDRGELDPVVASTATRLLNAISGGDPKPPKPEHNKKGEGRDG